MGFEGVLLILIFGLAIGFILGWCWLSASASQTSLHQRLKALQASQELLVEAWETHQELAEVREQTADPD